MGASSTGLPAFLKKGFPLNFPFSKISFPLIGWSGGAFWFGSLIKYSFHKKFPLSVKRVIFLSSVYDLPALKGAATISWLKKEYCCPFCQAVSHRTSFETVSTYTIVTVSGFTGTGFPSWSVRCIPGKRCSKKACELITSFLVWAQDDKRLTSSKTSIKLNA